MLNSRFLAIAILLSICPALVSSVSAQRDNWDVSKYLQGMDKNRNGSIDKEETSSRSRKWLGELGFDTSQPIDLKRVLRKVNRDRTAKESSQKREAARKVPGFGVETTAVAVSGFDGAGQEKVVDLKSKYSESVLQQVNRSLERYDRNKNGRLDKDEVEKARWGSPPISESDKNKDGALSQSELAERYSIRERSSSQRSGSSPSVKPSTRSNGISRSGRDSSSRFSRGTSNKLSSRSRSTPVSRSGSSSTASTKSFNSGNDKYVRYADGLIKQYDKNKDGRISRSEAKDMRRAPDGADGNDDGYITKSELIDALSGKAAKSEKKTTTLSKTERPSRSTRYRGSDRGAKTTTRTKTVSFSENDLNEDGQLQMHEYAKEWDQSILEEFRRRDLNDDGIITAEEWSKSR